MVNVGTGNLLVQDDDMSVAHKGVAMALRRTYNSQSRHDVNGSDGAVPSMFGNGWTNTFDAHVSGSQTGTVTVWDIDGTRYDYTYVDGTTWAPPPGEHATLTSDGSCGLLWVKRTGTVYYFWAPGQAASGPCAGSWYSSYGAYTGRLAMIIGRNRNAYIAFYYSWDGGNSGPGGKVSQISAQAESGMTSTLTFADVNGHRLLQQLTFPDNVTVVQYGYDGSGNLTWVSYPPNNSAGTRPVQLFGYQAVGADQVLQYVASPRWCGGSPSGCGYDGAYVYATFSGSTAPTSTVNLVVHGGTVNPPIADGTNTPLYPGYVPAALNYSNYLIEYYTTGVTTPTLRDTDGHMTNWVVDGSGRPTQTQVCTQSTGQGQQCTGTWLVTNETWDSANNSTSQTDARGNETDFAYDANGNVIAVGHPLVTNSAGTYKPTELLDYDDFDNITAYCDPAQVHAAGADWAGTPPVSHTLCSSRVGTSTRITLSYPSYQPSGQVAAIVKPDGYTRHFVYDPASQGGADFGLPTRVYGDTFTQIDGTSTTEQKLLAYDANGNVTSYDRGNGATTIQHDALGRPTQATDADGVSLYRGYYPDGMLKFEQDAAQHAAGILDTYTYDLDGNRVSLTTHFGNKVGVQQWWYDGADRLVEALVPTDQSTPAPGAPPLDYYAYPYMTRRLYDITSGGQPTALGLPHTAHGNMYATQEYVPTNGTPAWNVLQANDYDALDRTVATYRSSACADPVGVNAGAAPCTRTILQSTDQYDATPQTYGLLVTSTNSLGESLSRSYDTLGRIVSVSYSGGSGPVRTFAYGANGQVSSEAVGGGGSTSYAYDVDGRLTTITETAFGSFTSPATITHAYYPNGWRRSVAVSSSALTASPLLSYAYRNDGAQTLRRLSYPNQYDFTTGYTAAGRVVTSTSPFSAQENNYQYNAYGQATQRTTPEGICSGLTYDQESRLSGFTFGGATISMTRDASGQLLYGTGFGGGFSYSNTSANGVLLKDSGANSAWDTLNHAVLQTPVNGSISSIFFDSALRQHRDDTSNLVTTTDSNGNSCSRGTTTRTLFNYDRENHLTSGSFTSTRYSFTLDESLNCLQQSSSVTYGHGYTFNARGALTLLSHTAGILSMSESLHRDPDDVLFTTNGAGGLNRIWVDDIAFYDASTRALNVYQRDMSGRYLGTETPSGRPYPAFLHWPYDPDDPPAAINNTNTVAVWSLLQSKADAATDSFATFAGARTVNTDVSQWTTPDAFTGFPSDPLSQQAYMWNRNDPYSYTDPSGFSPQRAATADIEGGWIGLNHIGYPGYIYDQLNEELANQMEVTPDDVASEAVSDTPVAMVDSFGGKVGKGGFSLSELLKGIFSKRKRYRAVDEGSHPVRAR